LLTTEQANKRIELLQAEERQQLDLFHKIGASRELSPLITAARGQYVDGEALKTATIRVLGIMISRLDRMLQGNTIASLQTAIDSLQSEFRIF
jgi:hypothetical protein